MARDLTQVISSDGFNLLTKLPGGAPAAFDLAFKACVNSASSEEGFDPVEGLPALSGFLIEENLCDWYELDDAFVSAILRLLLDSQDPEPNYTRAADDLAKNIYFRSQVGPGHYPLRSLRFLQEMSTRQVMRIIATKTLKSSPLPGEIISMVEDQLLAQRGLLSQPCRHAWAASRPALTNPMCPTNECAAPTCANRSLTRWSKLECRWLTVHMEYYDEGKEAICIIDSCCGHHDDQLSDLEWATSEALETLYQF